MRVLPARGVVRISHVGSTAVPGIWAKPTLDILVETADAACFRAASAALNNSGYLCMAETEQRHSFNKGYTPDGFAERVFHIHLRVAGDHDELYFRDYLTEHPAAAKDYEALKMQLWKMFEHDRDAYTQSKTAFVQRYTRLAKERYPGRYE